MDKTIILDNKEINLRSSIFTIIDYKNTFGTDLDKEFEEIGKSTSSAKTLEIIFKLIYILNKPFRKEYIGFDKFCESFSLDALQGDELQDAMNNINELLKSHKKTP